MDNCRVGMALANAARVITSAAATTTGHWFGILIIMFSAATTKTPVVAKKFLSSQGCNTRTKSLVPNHTSDNLTAARPVKLSQGVCCVSSLTNIISDCDGVTYRYQQSNNFKMCRKPGNTFCKVPYCVLPHLQSINARTFLS
jgi:hypothetical protein